MGEEHHLFSKEIILDNFALCCFIIILHGIPQVCTALEQQH